MTTSAFPALTAVEQAFYTIVWTPMVKAGETWLETAVPALDFPILKQVDEAVLQSITDWVYGQVVEFVDISAIQLMNPILQNKWATASESLAIIAKEQGTSSDAYKQALSTAASDFAQWVHT